MTVLWQPVIKHPASRLQIFPAIITPSSKDEHVTLAVKHRGIRITDLNGGIGLGGLPSLLMIPTPVVLMRRRRMNRRILNWIVISGLVFFVLLAAILLKWRYDSLQAFPLVPHHHAVQLDPHNTWVEPT